MEWLELKIDTSHAGLDAVTDMLEQQGVTGVMIDDEADFQSFLENNRQYWDYVDDDLLAQKKGVSRVTFYLERNEDAYGTVAAVRMAMSALKKEHPEYAPLLLTMADVADEDWENNWKQFYKPMEIGSHLLVVPEWEEAADPTRVKLVLNPGLTFGTGSHATTIDEKCVDVAYENAALNGIGKDRYTVRWGNVLTDAALRQEMGAGYDIVVANIVADVIMGLSPHVRPFLKPGGLFLCSGIIDDRAAEVLEKLKADGWDVFEQRSSEGWFSYLCK